MLRSLTLLLAFSLGCGFHFAVGENRHGGPLAPITIQDLGAHRVGEVLRQRLPAALAARGLRQGPGEARKLSIQIQPWTELPLYSSVPNSGVVPFGEQFTVEATARIDGDGRLYRARATVQVSPEGDPAGRVQALERAAASLGQRLAEALGEALK